LSRLILLFLFLIFSACSSITPNAALKNTYWSLVELNNQDSSNAEHQPEVHLLFHLNDKSLHGSDGCNQIRATYTKEGEHFNFHEIISTRLFCEEGMDQAQAFLQALGKTDQLVIIENEMFLYQNGLKIAVFEAKEDY